ncbi:MULTISPECIES: DeoR/GlpR family DNA-binding transcription regulator [Novosphingobium]|jgi:DeoR family ulaG and ulaABCDEF operon transcriptional repressor|uniref:DeoR/GlpR family DNA-binding transcription regulator n=1 Tax=Novosphingobium TaxID=165696 RepID=UPI0022F27549|nr:MULTISPECIES: DeoR/GlpR family DNA-binding transcription regulator [Novosphingobium]GLK44857.1 DeoR family transcriptional regulator [Novosphingobium resinovorum]
MHSTQRESLILEAVAATGFVTYRALEALLEASPATIRRDLTRLEEEGLIVRVHGGAKAPQDQKEERESGLSGTPFAQSILQNLPAKQAIGRAAAALCLPGEGIMIDGGTTTLQMCPHLAGLDCQVLTNSLHIVDALLPQEGTRVLLPSGTVFREQNIVLAPAGEESMPRFHAPKLFMGAAAIGPQGVMQQDIILVAAERSFIKRAETLILLIDSSKFVSISGSIVCDLSEVDVVITDKGVDRQALEMLEDAGIEVVVA